LDESIGLDPLKYFFEPKQVALVGATEKLGFGYGQTRTLIERESGRRLFLINPSKATVFGRRTYARISDLPGRADLAVLIVSSPKVPAILREWAAKGGKTAIIQSAGFAEIGARGRSLQEEISTIAQETGLRIIGPNCVGLVNTANGFSTTETTPEAMTPGPIGVIAQSGVFGNILMDWGPEQGVYFSKVVTLGNRCDVDESELIRYLGRDAQTRVIALYLEGVKDGRRFMAAVREVAPDKPIIILKSGRSSAGRAATVSHTGTLSGNDEIYSGVFSQVGVLRADNIQELFDLAKALTIRPLPKGKRIAILTTSGSLGAMTADVCADHGLALAELSAETIQAVRADAPPWMNVKNPLDIGPSGLFGRTLDRLMQDPRVDAVIAIFVIPWMIVQSVEAQGLTPQQFLGDLAGSPKYWGNKPLLVSIIGKQALKTMALSITQGKVPVISTPENAVRALAAMIEYQMRTSG